ncbi:MAG: nitrogenase iron protein, partial [Methanoregula sp.]
APESEQADVYRVLAKKILSNQDRYVPAPLDTDQLKDWAESWSDKLLEVRDSPTHVKCELECIVPGAEPIIAKSRSQRIPMTKAPTQRKTVKAKG